jgi:predicted dehydrogenase
MEAMWTRFLPTMIELKETLNSNIIGNIEKIDITFGFQAMLKPKNRLFDPNMGGGALLDIGVYPLTVAHMFLGLPTSFDTKAVLNDYVFDMSHDITLYYENAQVNISCALNQELENKVYIYGSKGYVVIDLFWRTEKADIYDLNHQLIKTIAHPHLINGFEYEIKEVISCIKNNNKESKVMTHQMTIDIMKLMDDIRNVWQLKFPCEDI